MKNQLRNLFTLLFIAAFVFACSKDETADISMNDNDMSTNEVAQRCDEIITVDFLAGQYNDAGDVTVHQIGDTEISILITMQNGYSLGRYHIYFGPEQELPKTKKQGNPKIGRFNHKSGNLGGVASSELIIPIDPDGAYPVVIAVHGEVSGPTNETAWGDGRQITDGGSWAMLIDFEIDECDPDIVNICTGFKTLTQDQWGDPNSEGGLMLTNDFIELAGLTGMISIGCNDTTEYDNGADLVSYLPDNGPMDNMSSTYLNNTSSISTAVGELIACRLNLAADANIPTFSTAGSALGDQSYIGLNNYFGLTVNQILLDGEKVLTGCLTANLAEVHGAIVNINESYANGNTSSDYLFCPFGG